MDEQDEREALARVVTASLRGRRWRDLTPLDIATTVMASAWLLAHDRRVAAEALRSAVRRLSKYDGVRSALLDYAERVEAGDE